MKNNNNDNNNSKKNINADGEGKYVNGLPGCDCHHKVQKREREAESREARVRDTQVAGFRKVEEKREHYRKRRKGRQTEMFKERASV